MRPDEARDVGRLGAVALRGGATRVQEVHRGVAGRVFRVLGPAAAPVRVVHDAVSTTSYAAVRTGLGLGAVAAGVVAARRATGTSLQERPGGRLGLAWLNGTHGDLLDRHAPALALPMTVRQHGVDVPLERDALLAAHPSPSSRLVVFLHGLTEDEHSWCYRSVQHHGAEHVTYGTLLERDLGCTAVFLRYGTGRRIADNGRALAELLPRLVEQWPVPVQDLVLVGHSMGGLVARSALHQAGSGTADPALWTRLVRDTVTLGSPHLGAPLERGAHRATRLLARLPETRPLATLLATRSVGIKDLGHGALLQQDWEGRDPDAPYTDRPTGVPLHDGARHFVVLATLTRDPDAPVSRVLGDLLVPPLSATGDTGADDRLAFPADHVHRLGGLHHFDLLNHPAVYAQLRRWLVERPD